MKFRFLFLCVMSTVYILDARDCKVRTTMSEDYSSAETIQCNEVFYKKFLGQNILCNGEEMDVQKATESSQCNVYNGVLAIPSYVTQNDACVSLCAFPECTSDGSWSYTSLSGINSDIYRNLNLSRFIPVNLLPKVPFGILDRMTFSSNQVCPYEDSKNKGDPFVGCKCSTSNVQEESKDVPQPTSFDRTLTSVVFPIVSSTAGIAIGASIVASMMGSATASSTGSSISGGLLLFDQAQFGCMIGQIPLADVNSLLPNVSQSLSWTSFGIGGIFPRPSKEEEEDSRREIHDASVRTSSESQGDSKSSSISLSSVLKSEVAQYAYRLGIQPGDLFYTTLVILLLLFGFSIVVYLLIVGIMRGLGKCTPTFSDNCKDRLVGLWILFAILSQYAIGMTAVFHITLSWIKGEALGAAVAAFILVFFAGGIVVYGLFIIKKNENELKDMGTVEHLQKPIAKRYGALYDEYSFENRFFFAPKLGLALLTGMTTGCVGFSSVTQIVILLVLNVAFMFHLEIRQPYLTTFMHQTAFILLTMKVAVLILMVFLIIQDFFPADLQKIVNSIILGIQFAVILCLLLRQCYIMYSKYQSSQQTKKTRELTSPIISPMGTYDPLYTPIKGKTQVKPQFNSTASRVGLRPIDAPGFHDNLQTIPPHYVSSSSSFYGRHHDQSNHPHHTIDDHSEQLRMSSESHLARNCSYSSDEESVDFHHSSKNNNNVNRYVYGDESFSKQKRDASFVLL